MFIRSDEDEKMTGSGSLPPEPLSPVTAFESHAGEGHLSGWVGTGGESAFGNKARGVSVVGPHPLALLPKVSVYSFYKSCIPA